jgi:hypothetical protein
MTAGDSALVRVVATTISTWVVPGASEKAGTGSRKPLMFEQPVSPKAAMLTRHILRKACLKARGQLSRKRPRFRNVTTLHCEFRFNPAGDSDLMPATIPI